MNDVFISHSSQDKPTIVRKLAQCLRENGLEVWLDEDKILCGDNILEEIEKGISSSLCVILVITSAFFKSNWTSLELGLARSSAKCAIIPVLANISKKEIAERYPFLLAKKYISLDTRNITNTAKQVFDTVVEFKKRKHFEEPLDYQEAVRTLNSFDTPATNTVSILIVEYEQICKISPSTGIFHAKKIANAVIDDVYSRTEHGVGLGYLKWQEKLVILQSHNSGINDNIISHLKALLSTSNTNCLSNEQDQKKLTDLSLAAVLSWYTSYISTILSAEKETDRYRIASPGSLSYHDFVDIYEIDKCVLRGDLIATPEVTYQWYQYNIYTHIAVRSEKTGNIVGYFALLPVTDELYNQIQSGDFKDNNLPIDGIRQYNIPDFYKLYAAAVCIHPQHQNTTAFTRLYHALIQMMYELATEREAYITDIITEASTKQGEKLCKILGLRKLMDTNINTELYTASLLPPSLRLNSLFGHKLIQFYQERYDEMRDLF